MLGKGALKDLSSTGWDIPRYPRSCASSSGLDLNEVGGVEGVELSNGGFMTLPKDLAAISIVHLTMPDDY